MMRYARGLIGGRCRRRMKFPLLVRLLRAASTLVVNYGDLLPNEVRVCVCCTLNRFFLPVDILHTQCLLILHPREIQALWPQTTTHTEITHRNGGKDI